MFCFDVKRNMKSEKHVTVMDFADYLGKSDVSANSKVYHRRYLRNGLHERYCYIK